MTVADPVHLNPDYSQPGCVREHCGARAVIMLTDEAGANTFYCGDHAELAVSMAEKGST